MRGQGLLWALGLPSPCARAVVDAALQHGLLLNAPQPATLRFMPALDVSAQEIEQMLERLGLALSDALAA